MAKAGARRLDGGRVVKLSLVRRSPIQLPSGADETVAALEDLLAQARRGEVVGVAFVARMPGRNFLVDMAGRAYSDPVCTRGALCSLDDQLARLIEAGVTDDYPDSSRP
jgi:hypothetical protein